MSSRENRQLHVLLVDPAALLTPGALDRMQSPHTTLDHMSSPDAAARAAERAAGDLAIAVVPGDHEGERGADAIERTCHVTAALAEMVRRRPDRQVLVTTAEQLRRRWPAIVAAARAFLWGGVEPPGRDVGGSDSFPDMIGDAPATRAMQRMIERVAASDRPVLVVGPTGTGKELVVESIHRLGHNPSAPLLDLNCGAIPDTLMESLLFGHARGAFTGAEQAQEGYLAAVGRGTLFLDEIAELPLLLQAKLLRVLETRKYRRLGSTEVRTFHGRIVAATHADLRARADQRLFREDLYYRLAVLTVDVPSLDLRGDDIPLLAQHFARQQARPLRFTADALAFLQALDWPGNIRQLRNEIDRLAVIASEDLIDVDELRRSLRREPRERRRATPHLHDLASALLHAGGGDKLAAARDLLIDAAMRENGGNKSAAARALGVHRKVLERRLGRDESAEMAAPRREYEGV